MLLPLRHHICFHCCHSLLPHVQFLLILFILSNFVAHLFDYFAFSCGFYGFSTRNLVVLRFPSFFQSNFLFLYIFLLLIVLFPLIFLAFSLYICCHSIFLLAFPLFLLFRRVKAPFLPSFGTIRFFFRPNSLPLGSRTKYVADCFVPLSPRLRREFSHSAAIVIECKWLICLSGAIIHFLPDPIRWPNVIEAQSSKSNARIKPHSATDTQLRRWLGKFSNAKHFNDTNTK